MILASDVFRIKEEEKTESMISTILHSEKTNSQEILFSNVSLRAFELPSSTDLRLQWYLLFSRSGSWCIRRVAVRSFHWERKVEQQIDKERQPLSEFDRPVQSTENMDFSDKMSIARNQAHLQDINWTFDWSTSILESRIFVVLG